jgi:hypothetical protein
MFHVYLGHVLSLPLEPVLVSFSTAWLAIGWVNRSAHGRWKWVWPDIRWLARAWGGGLGATITEFAACMSFWFTVGA